MKIKEVHLSNNEVITYYEQGLSSSNEVLLLIHGNTSSALSFEPLIQVLSEHLKVIAPNLRGYSHSSYLARIDHISDFTLDLKLMLDQLNIKKVNILGWEMGGAISMDFASTYPKLVKSLILMSSVAPSGYPIYRKDQNANSMIGNVYLSRDELKLDPVDVDPLIRIFNDKDINLLSHEYDYMIYPSKKPDDLLNMRWIEEAIMQKNIVDTKWALANFNITPVNSHYSKGSNKISNINASTLTLWGNKDLIITKKMYDETLKYFPSSKTQIFDNAGHSLIVDDLNLLSSTIIDYILLK